MRKIIIYLLCILFLFYFATVAASASYKPFVGNKKTKVYHMEKCPYVDKMLDENRIYFNTRKHAERSGYRACNYCKDGVVESGSSNGNYAPTTRPKDTEPATTNHPGTEVATESMQQATQESTNQTDNYNQNTKVLYVVIVALFGALCFASGKKTNKP